MDDFDRDTVDAEVERLTALSLAKRVPYFDRFSRQSTGTERIMSPPAEDTGLTHSDIEEAASELAQRAGIPYTGLMEGIREVATGRSVNELALAFRRKPEQTGVSPCKLR